MSHNTSKLNSNKGRESSSKIQEGGPNGQTFQFKDNRPEAIANSELQQMANLSSSSRQLVQMQTMANNYTSPSAPIQKKGNMDGLPNDLKSGVENLSGYAMDDVKVHYNSNKPSQLQAHAYAQGTDIHLASGQEKHLPHEAWHVVQQKQGRVKPTSQMKNGAQVNTDQGLEKEADIMGAKARAEAVQLKNDTSLIQGTASNSTAQLAPAAFTGFVTAPAKYDGWTKKFDSWGKLESAIESYANLEDDDVAKRSELVSAMTSLSIEWLKGYTQRQSTQADPKDGVRKGLFDLLHPLLTTEELELKATEGKLSDKEHSVSEDPRLTKDLPVPEGTKNAPKGGVFKSNSEVKNQALVKIDDGIAGKVCQILMGWRADQKTGAIAAEKGDYHKVKEEVPEFAGKNSQKLKTGFVKKDKLIETNRVKDAPGLKYKDKTSHLKFPLFAKPPSKNDIVQVGLGDCYLLAAMVSIVNADPSHFIKHMRDNRDGTVTVKLYKDAGVPVVITIKKSVVVKDKFLERNQVPAFASGALWVQLYEKAYVAAGFIGSGPETLPSAEKSYGMIEGGYGHIAQTHITGKAAENHPIQINREDVQGKISGYFNSPEMKFHFQGLTTPDVSYEHGTKDPKYLEDMHQYEHLLKASQKLQELMNKTFVTTADLSEMLTKEGIKQIYIDIVMNKVKAAKIMTGPLGSGKYSKGELDLFNSITSKMIIGKTMTIGTRKDIFDNPEEVLERGDSAGEAKVKGLVGPHEYAILDYAPKPIEEGKALSLKLRNPWSSYGRKYKKPTEETPVSNETGDTFEGAERIAVPGPEGAESWFDLADIGAYFTSFSSA
ncbi:MAG: C2 family cysteine protease [Bacteroidota bacterium]